MADGAEILTDLLVMLLYLTAAATILGNVLVIISILSQDRTRRVRSNKFLVSLAMADLCVGMFVMIPSVVKIQAGQWFWGPDFCKVWVTLDVLFSSASIYSLIGISIDRFYAVYKPVQYALHTSDRVAYFLIFMAWTIAAVISFPMYLNIRQFSTWTRAVEKHDTICSTPTDSTSAGYVLYSGTMAFILPALLLTTLYIAIGIKMRSRQKKKIKLAKKGCKMAVKVDVAPATKMNTSAPISKMTTTTMVTKTTNINNNVRTDIISDCVIVAATTECVVTAPTAVIAAGGEQQQLHQPGQEQLRQPGEQLQKPGDDEQQLEKPTQDFLVPCPAVEGRPVTVLSQYSVTQKVEESISSWKDTDLNDCQQDTTNDNQGAESLQENEIQQLKKFLKNKNKTSSHRRSKNKSLCKAEKKLKIEEKKQTRITFMMAVIIGTFAMCWSPFAVMFFLSPYSSTFSHFLETYPWVADIFTWIGYLNSSLNPVIYASMNQEIRTGMARLACPAKYSVNL